ncbi:hypothetical protein CLOHYLEM_07571 [[Clostridium] hylemonae DSM 15053]|uniref:Uncharacterized protein n=1 Tax=[Clostridium] hylemonae DSM 15053 TaxID=553973 RepID=C0C633_9FIRM|nr:hypothetical protein CLOHYLEM_07571 [[Clostridium] hylemonae DSM 15053]
MPLTAEHPVMTQAADILHKTMTAFLNLLRADSIFFMLFIPPHFIRCALSAPAMLQSQDSVRL